MPLHLDVYDPQSDSWLEVGRMRPGDHVGSMSDNRGDGTRDVYVFRCLPDDSASLLCIAGSGMDIASSRWREHFELQPWRVIKHLLPGKPHELIVRPDRSPVPRTIRLTHRSET